MPKLILLTNGGVRSLVSTAMVLSWPQAMSVTLLHMKRQQPAKDARLGAVRRQAAHFSKCRLIEIEEPVIRADGREPRPGSNLSASDRQPSTGTQSVAGMQSAATAGTPLPVMRLLTSAMTLSATLGATRIIWPVSFNGDFSEITRAMEQTVLARHLAAIEIDNPPVVECPMMDLMGRQIIELGSQLKVPWELSWSCEREGAEHCRSCAGCRRRAVAFESAGIDDPLGVKSSRVYAA